MFISQDRKLFSSFLIANFSVFGVGARKQLVFPIFPELWPATSNLLRLSLSNGFSYEVVTSQSAVRPRVRYHGTYADRIWYVHAAFSVPGDSPDFSAFSVLIIYVLIYLSCILGSSETLWGPNFTTPCPFVALVLLVPYCQCIRSIIPSVSTQRSIELRTYSSYHPSFMHLASSATT